MEQNSAPKSSTLLLCKQAKEAATSVAALSTYEKNAAILKCADELVLHIPNILAANEIDISNARGTMSEVMLDRLKLTEERILSMASGMREVAELPNPVGRIIDEINRPNGLKIQKVSVPLGVIAIIYESRPNVTSDAATLCFKSGNACVLRGGKESYTTSKEIVAALKAGLKKCGITENAINLVDDLTRQSATDLMCARGLVDLLIPRGGANLINNVVENSKVPYLQTGTGICHVYVDKTANLSMAVDIIENAKTSRPSVCNAEEVCLVHSDIAREFLPMLKLRIVDERIKKGLNPVELRLCERSKEIIPGVLAKDSDFDTEFLDYILAVKIVDNTEEAIKHINTHSTSHSECIVTESENSKTAFINSIDSAAVYINASTRFTDGGEFGLGCEIGISTQKLHARGPVGLNELNTYKYVINGQGQIR